MGKSDATPLAKSEYIYITNNTHIMKKLLALAALVLACTASMKAQVKVTCNGKDVATNDVVTFYADVDEGDGSGEVLAREPMIVNTGDEAVDLKVTVVIDRKLASEKMFSWCGITGSCGEMSTFTETREAPLAPGQSIDMSLHANFKSGNYMTTNANVTVMADNEYVTSFVLRYIYADPTGISQVKADNKGLQVNDNTLSYAFGSAAPRTISLYATDGRLVKRAATTAANGTVSLAGLQRGLYLATTGMGSSVKIMVK